MASLAQSIKVAATYGRRKRQFYASKGRMTLFPESPRASAVKFWLQRQGQRPEESLQSIIA